MKSTTAKSQTSKVPSHLSKMSESRRTRLEEIQKREQLKGMLITKFRKKYGGENKKLQSYIDREVGAFMNNNRLTEGNLKELDDKIATQKATQAADGKSQASLASAASRASRRPQTAKPAAQVEKAPVLDDMKSHQSQASRASRNLKTDIHPTQPKKKAQDAESVITQSELDRPAESSSEVDEQDEWTAIQKFQAMLHYQEQQQVKERQEERKRLLVQELDRQRQAKEAKKKQLEEEDKQYHAQVVEHCKVMDLKEV